MSEPISMITRLSGPNPISVASQVRPTATQEEAQAPSFGGVLERAISGLDQTVKASDGMAEAYAAGGDVELHDVMISMQQAQISFELASQVRTKAVEAYQEIMRMQL